MVDLPRITVITPCLNQAKFLERTICSVLDQGYEGLEYAVVDGGSRDGSVDVIRRYEDDLAWWYSIEDEGPADLLNRALAHASGDVIAYLPSGDLYAPLALHQVAERMGGADGPAWLVGGCITVDAEDRVVRGANYDAPYDLGDYLRGGGEGLAHGGSFFRAELLRDAGGFETMLHHRYDLEFNCRLLANGVYPEILHEPVALHRARGGARSGRDPVSSRRERAEVMRRYSRLGAATAMPIGVAA